MSCQLVQVWDRALAPTRGLHTKQKVQIQGMVLGGYYVYKSNQPMASLHSYVQQPNFINESLIGYPKHAKRGKDAHTYVNLMFTITIHSFASSHASSIHSFIIIMSSHIKLSFLVIIIIMPSYTSYYHHTHVNHFILSHHLCYQTYMWSYMIMELCDYPPCYLSYCIISAP